MKLLICPDCLLEREVDDNSKISLCSCCLVEMIEKKIKIGDDDGRKDN